MHGMLDFDQQIDLNPPAPHPNFFQQCLSNLYDQQSPLEAPPVPQTSTLDALCYLEHHTDLARTPMQDLLEVVANNQALSGVNFVALRKQIAKKKSQIKRKRAKQRNHTGQAHITRVTTTIQPVPEEDEEAKRQRNRISAQISRDRKKQRVQQLEERNVLLEAECQRATEQNKKLRAQLQQVPLAFGSALQNKLTRLLILLGVIFLATTVRDTVNSQALMAGKAPTPAQTPSSSPLRSGSEEDFDPLLESVRGPLADLLAKQPSLLEPVEKRVVTGVRELEEVMAALPVAVTERLRSAVQFEQL